MISDPVMSNFCIRIVDQVTDRVLVGIYLSINNLFTSFLIFFFSYFLLFVLVPSKDKSENFL